MDLQRGVLGVWPSVTSRPNIDDGHHVDLHVEALEDDQGRVCTSKAEVVDVLVADAARLGSSEVVDEHRTVCAGVLVSHVWVLLPDLCGDVMGGPYLERSLQRVLLVRTEGVEVHDAIGATLVKGVDWLHGGDADSGAWVSIPGEVTTVSCVCSQRFIAKVVAQALNQIAVQCVDSIGEHHAINSGRLALVLAVDEQDLLDGDIVWEAKSSIRV